MGKGETLKDYQGWVTRPENDTVLTELIRTWIRDLSQNEAAMLVAEPVSKLQRMGIQLLKQSSEQYYLQGPMIAVGAASDEATVDIYIYIYIFIYIYTLIYFTLCMCKQYTFDH